MKIQTNKLIYSLLAVAVLAVSACKKDSKFIPEEPVAPVSGVYILNEGYFASDNSSLYYFDLKNEKMIEDYFLGKNPGKKLGDVANDMGIYGSKLYITVNRSQKVEVVDAETGVVVKTVNVDEPRFLAFHGKHAFVSSYTNKVFVLDTASLAIVKEIEVGRTPEQLAVSGDRVFVANAGWQEALSPDGEGNYDNRLSVIDANRLEKIEDIEVADNIDRVFVDEQGAVYVNSETIYEADWVTVSKPSRLFKIDPKALKIDKEFDFGAGLIAFQGNTAYLFSANYEDDKTSFLKMNLSTFDIEVQELFQDVAAPYALEVDPDSKDIWVGDGMNHQVHRLKKGEKEADKYPVGLLPKKFVFKR